MISLRELARDLGKDRSSLRRAIIKKFGRQAFQKHNCSVTGQDILVLADHDAAIVRDYFRSGCDSHIQKPQKEVASRPGVFYAIALVPELSEVRVKFGYTDSLAERVKAFSTTCPTLKVLATWECDRNLEAAALKAIDSNQETIRVGVEVFDVHNMESVIRVLDTLFSITSGKVLKTREMKPIALPECPQPFSSRYPPAEQASTNYMPPLHQPRSERFFFC